MSGELPDNLRPVADFFGLPDTATVAKDFHVVRAIGTIAAVDTAPFALIFGGGTALARAHKLIRRMSEDVDFKIVPDAANPLSRNKLRQQLAVVRERVTTALREAGFQFDPTDVQSQNENRYTRYQLGYEGRIGVTETLRPTIQIELTYANLRLPSVTRPVSSFVNEATNQPPEVPAIPCVSLAETAAEKLVSLTRRTAMELAGLSRDPDTALVRHIYDLHILRGHVDPDQVAALAGAIATTDGEEFKNQYPAYASDPAAETRRALGALHTDPTHRRRYDEFMATMVYGERMEYDRAFATVAELAEIVWQIKKE